MTPEEKAEYDAIETALSYEQINLFAERFHSVRSTLMACVILACV